MKKPNGRLAAAIVLALSAAVVPVAGSAVPAAASGPPASIKPGLPWFDSSGHLIQGHNGSLISFGGKYYWIGQDLIGGRTGAACYESTDLVHWQRDEPVAPASPDILTVATAPGGTPPGFGLADSDNYLIGNTQVMYDPATEKFVLWVSVSVDDPAPRPWSDFLVGVAEASASDPGATPCGPYSWVRTPFHPFVKQGSPGQAVGDIGLFSYTDTSTTPSKTYFYLANADQGEPCNPGDPNCYEQNSDGTADLSSTCSTAPCMTGQQLRIYLITPAGQSGEDTMLVDTAAHFYGLYEAPALFQAGSGMCGPTSYRTTTTPLPTRSPAIPRPSTCWRPREPAPEPRRATSTWVTAGTHPRSQEVRTTRSATPATSGSR